jgi:hypothetical protein
MAEGTVIALERVAAVLMSDGRWHDIVLGSFRIAPLVFSVSARNLDRVGATWVESGGRVQQTVFCPMEWIQGLRYAEETIDIDADTNDRSPAERV